MAIAFANAAVTTASVPPAAVGDSPRSTGAGGPGTTPRAPQFNSMVGAGPAGPSSDRATWTFRERPDPNTMLFTTPEAGSTRSGDSVPRERNRGRRLVSSGWSSSAANPSCSGSGAYLDFVLGVSQSIAKGHRHRVSLTVNRRLLLTWLMALVRRRGSCGAMPVEVASHINDFLGDAWEVVPFDAVAIRTITENARERRFQEMTAFVEGFLSDIVRSAIIPNAVQGRDSACWRTPASILEQVAKLNDTQMSPSAIIELKLKELGYTISDWVSDGEGMTWTVTW
mmetsp:Transcript_84804/g.186168  ORF Transcript_84804/g.186168 Transcript_84804/m.186168 type:complete len:283 (+) Transcript_84804:190-1038(+)